MNKKHLLSLIFIFAIQINHAQNSWQLLGNDITYNTGNVILNDGMNFIIKDTRTATTGKYNSGYKFFDFYGESGAIMLEHNGYFGNAARILKFFLNGTERLRINSNGNLGIDLESPLEKVTIGNGGSFGVQDTRTSTTELYSSGYKFFDFYGESASIMLEHNGYFGNGIRKLKFFVNGAERLRINSNGNVGIGLDNPIAKLDVNGTIRATEVKVCLNQGCDFVFENDYKLMSINELDNYVKTHKHLPEIDPAAKMENEGINLSEMNAKLLQKIEEQTLYIIELNKRLEKLESKKYSGQ